MNDDDPWQQYALIFSELHLKAIKWVRDCLIRENLPLPVTTETAIEAAEKWIRGGKNWRQLEEISRQAGIVRDNAQCNLAHTNTLEQTRQTIDLEIATLLGAFLDALVKLDPDWQKEELAKEFSAFHTPRQIRNYASQIIKDSVLSHIPFALVEIFGQDNTAWEERMIDEVVAIYVAEMA